MVPSQLELRERKVARTPDGRAWHAGPCVLSDEMIRVVVPAIVAETMQISSRLNTLR
jgi:hypothetical protein